MLKKKGFTLIELLVVIAIIAILVVLIILALNAARARARDSGRKTDLRAVQTALEMQNDDTGTYSAVNTYAALTNEIEAAGNYGLGVGDMPQDTNGEGCGFGCNTAGDGQDYALGASLETTTPNTNETCGTPVAGWTNGNPYCVGTNIDQAVF